MVLKVHHSFLKLDGAEESLFYTRSPSLILCLLWIIQYPSRYSGMEYFNPNSGADCCHLICLSVCLVLGGFWEDFQLLGVHSHLYNTVVFYTQQMALQEFNFRWLYFKCRVLKLILTRIPANHRSSFLLNFSTFSPKLSPILQPWSHLLLHSYFPFLLK